MGNSPFAVDTRKELVAILGKRNGYIQLATRDSIETYADWSDAPLQAAKAWAIQLEALGSPRIYWITLSEEVRHLHIHLFPRWKADTLKGVALFETRNTEPQPDWEAPVLTALAQWAEQFDVEVVTL